MVEKDEREGKIIYQEGKIEVRDHPRDPEAHNVGIGNEYFLLMRGILEDYAERIPYEDLEGRLGNYNSNIVYALNIEKISPQAFGLILARARLQERDTEISYANEQIRDLRDRLSDDNRDDDFN